MTAKVEQVQIRVTADEKLRLKQRARRAGLDLSSYVLRSALGENSRELAEILNSLRDDANRTYGLAAMSDLLSRSGSGELREILAATDLRGLSPFAGNYVAAMIEHECAQRGLTVPSSLREIEPLPTPWFATQITSLRMHLLREAPVAFRRRNIFVDQSVRV